MFLTNNSKISERELGRHRQFENAEEGLRLGGRQR